MTKKTCRARKSFCIIAVAAMLALACGGNQEIDELSDAHIVTFNAGDVTAAVTGMPSNQTVENDGYATRPDTDPAAKGYGFVDWFAQETGGDAFDFENTPITGPTTIWARWIPPIGIPPNFFTNDAWEQIRDDAGGVENSDLLQEDGSLFFRYNNMGTYVGAPSVGDRVHMAFNLRHDVMTEGDPNWTIRFGAADNYNTADYFSLTQRFNNLYINVNHYWWGVQTSFGGHDITSWEWYRLDIIAHITEDDIRFRLYINGTFAPLTGTGGDGAMTTADGVATYTGDTAFGGWFLVKTWANTIYIGPVAAD